LTNTVWPKPRMLLAIVSKMSKEGLLNEKSKGKFYIYNKRIIERFDHIK